MKYNLFKRKTLIIVITSMKVSFLRSNNSRVIQIKLGMSRYHPNAKINKKNGLDL